MPFRLENGQVLLTEANKNLDLENNPTSAPTGAPIVELDTINPGFGYSTHPFGSLVTETDRINPGSVLIVIPGTPITETDTIGAATTGTLTVAGAGPGILTDENGNPLLDEHGLPLTDGTGIVELTTINPGSIGISPGFVVPGANISETDTINPGGQQIAGLGVPIVETDTIKGGTARVVTPGVLVAELDTINPGTVVLSSPAAISETDTINPGTVLIVIPGTPIVELDAINGGVANGGQLHFQFSPIHTTDTINPGRALIVIPGALIHETDLIQVSAIHRIFETDLINPGVAVITAPAFHPAFLLKSLAARNGRWQILSVRPDDTIDGVIESATTTVIGRHNALWSWTIDTGFDGDLNSPLGKLLVPGASIYIVVNDEILMSGPVTKPLRARNGDLSTVTVGGTDDLQRIADRTAHQDPAAGDTLLLNNTFGALEDDQSGAAETVIKHWVNVNAGPGAAPGRVVPGLTIEPDQRRGTALTWGARMDPLLDLITSKADPAGLGVRVRLDKTTGQRVFSVYEPADKTAEVVFGVKLGNMQAYQYGSQRPAANVLYVGGAGDGAARVFAVVEDQASIDDNGRIEQFLDQGSQTDVSKLVEAGQAQLATTAQQTFLNATVVDTGAHQWAPLVLDPQQEPYDLGDSVSVVVDGVKISEVIREITAVNGPTGTSVQPTIGSPNSGGPPEALFFRQLVAEIVALKSQVRELARR